MSKPSTKRFLSLPFSAALVISSLLVVPVMAQDATIVTGLVVDSVGTPVAGVLVTVRETGLATRTDSTGWFRIGVSPGATVLEFGRIGFGSFEHSLVVAAVAEQVVGTIVLSAEPVVLDEILVSEEAPLRDSPFLAQVQRMGFGDVMTREEIQRMNPSSVEDLLRRMSAVQFNAQGDPYFNGAPLWVCPSGPRVIVDKMHGTGAEALQLIIDPVRQIRTVYTYRGALEKCGVIAIETDPFVRGEPSPVRVGLRAGGSFGRDPRVVQIGGEVGMPLSRVVELRPGFDVFLNDASGWQAQIALVFRPEFAGPFYGGTSLGIEKLGASGSFTGRELRSNFTAFLGLEAGIRALFGFSEFQVVRPSATDVRVQVVAGLGVWVGGRR